MKGQWWPIFCSSTLNSAHVKCDVWTEATFRPNCEVKMSLPLLFWSSTQHWGRWHGQKWKRAANLTVQKWPTFRTLVKNLFKACKQKEVTFNLLHWVERNFKLKCALVLGPNYHHWHLKYVGSNLPSVWIYISFRCFGDYNDLPEIIINNDNLIPSKVRLSHLNLLLLPTLVEIKLWIIKLNFKKT